MKLDNEAGFYEKNLDFLEKLVPLVFSKVIESGFELPQTVTVVETSAGSIDLVTRLDNGSTATLYGEQDSVAEYQDELLDLNLNSCDSLFVMGMGLGSHALPQYACFLKNHPW